jgi:predicted DCC family thiol-disulfide oxidoreductase YuxK
VTPARIGQNGWTPGLYSVFRAAFGIYLAVHFVHLVPYGAELFSSAGMLPEASLSPFHGVFPNPLALADSPLAVQLFLLAATALGVAFAIGWCDRIAAVALWFALAALFNRNPLIANPALPFVGWMLLAHAALPRAPYGSWTARRPGSENAGWHMPPAIFAAAWIVMALGYSYSGYTKLESPSWIDGSALARVLENPLARSLFYREWLLALPPLFLQLGTWGGLGLELAYAPLALVRPLRRWIWLAMVGMHVSLLALVDFADLTVGMLFLHAFTFDPAWVPRARRAGAPPERVYYDGSCGLCHGAVRFALAEDRGGEAFRFAPLEGDTAAQRLSAEVRAALPDSLVVESANGALLVRSAAVLHIAENLGGAWRALAWLGRAVPQRVRDALYDTVARNRRSLARAPRAACPLAPVEHRRRFDP